MPPKNGKRRRSKKIEEEPPTPAEEEEHVKPQPPNIFLYVQLANIKSLPQTIHSLEIHLEQAGSLIVKCDEHYTIDGIIRQEEFFSKPTHTLIFQQDNLDRINHAADNPLLIMLYMRKSIPPHFLGEEEEEETLVEDETTEQPASPTLSRAMPPVREGSAIKSIGEPDDLERDEVNYYEEKETLVLLCVGYLDLIKLFGHTRCMIREDLFLYPMPDVPNELRTAVQTEWHLYTLLPIAKELTFTNMAFVTFESIYNLKPDTFEIDMEALQVELSFRSTLPNERNEYELIPWCSFSTLYHTPIGHQVFHYFFEYFRTKKIFPPSYNCTGLKSNMEVEMHKLFTHLMRTEGMEFDFSLMDQMFDEALICNSFHRYLMTRDMSEILAEAIACQRYVVAVDIWQITEPRRKVLQGFFNPSVLLYPNMQSMRFAVHLEYVNTKAKPKPKRLTIVSIMSQRSTRSTRSKHSGYYPSLPTFAIIKICLLAPLGEIYQELKLFHESFAAQNRLLFCDQPLKEIKIADLADTQREAYNRFDKFIIDTIAYIVEKKVHRVEDRKNHFCCAVQNLGNILLKLVGSDFNTRVPTKTSVEFANLCAMVFNELELRIHKLVEMVEDEGFDEVAVDEHEQLETLIEHMNAIKLLYAVGDERMENFMFEKIKAECRNADIFEFYYLISNMERGDYEKAKTYYETYRKVPEMHDYFAGWIKIYITYKDMSANEAVAGDAIECLLKSITQYSERHLRQSDGWILLYCYYKQFKYVPGCEYARWRYEDLYKLPRESLASAPYSMWGIFQNLYPTFQNTRGFIFYDVFKVFVRLGLYEFGQVVFKTIEHLCPEAERYLINSNLKILLKELEDKFAVRTFKFPSSLEGQQLMAFNAQANGNLEYYRGNWGKAMSYYQRNLDMPPVENERDNYLLSTLRLAYLAFDAGDYELTIRALTKPVIGRLMPLATMYMMGKAYYKLNNLDQALRTFAQGTRYGTHVPDIWAFLALINIRMGKNYNALECWKYAKIEPTKFVHDDIYAELELVDFDEVDLFIDLPSQS